MGQRDVCLVEEGALVERAKSDPEAFGELYERDCDRIYAFAYARLYSRADAEDATSERDSPLRWLGCFCQGRPQESRPVDLDIGWLRPWDFALSWAWYSCRPDCPCRRRAVRSACPEWPSRIA